MFDFFKKNKVNIWKVFADEMNGTFIPAKHDECSKAEIVYGNWKIILDNYYNYGETGSRVMFFTRVIAKFESLDNFKFEIYQTDFLRSIEKLFRAQDITIGVRDFDNRFILKANNEFKIKRLLQNSEIRNLLLSLRNVNIEISDKKGIWGHQLPDKEFELSYYTESDIQDTEE